MIGSQRAGRRLSVEAFDDAEVALDAVSEGGQRLLVGLTLACRDGLFEAVELDQDGALGDSSVVCDDPAAAGGSARPRHRRPDRPACCRQQLPGSAMVR